jgi:hypothetical protein
VSARQGVDGDGGAALEVPLEGEAVGEPYSVDEALPFVLFFLLIAITATLVVVIGWRVGDLTAPADAPLRDVELQGTVDLRGDAVEPYAPFGPHAHAVNLTLGVGDVLAVDFTALNAPVQVLVQRPIHPDNSTTSPAVVLATASGLSGAVTFEAVEPGAVQVYFVNPAAVQRPPSGTPPSEWHIAARLTYSVRVDRAG